MKKSMIVGFISVIFLGLFITSCKNETLSETETEYNEKAVYETQVTQKDCYLCGDNQESTLAQYWGQANVGLLNLNTLKCDVFPINRYDQNGNLMTVAVRFPSSNGFMGSSDEGSTLHYDVNTNRGYLNLSVSFNENSILNMDNLTPFFCTDCLSSIMNEYTYDGEYWDMALVDFEGKQVRPLDKSVSRFLLSNYYISAEYNEKFNSVHINGFYCPVRYSQLDYDPNATTLELIESYCAENGIPLMLNDELAEFIKHFKISGITIGDSYIEFQGGMKLLNVSDDGSYWITGK